MDADFAYGLKGCSIGGYKDWRSFKGWNTILIKMWCNYSIDYSVLFLV